MCGISNLQAQRNIPIPIIIIPLKYIRHPLQANARLHKQIKAQPILPRPLIAARPRILRISIEQQLHKLRAQAVSKRHQRIRELEAMPSTMGYGNFDTNIDVTQEERSKEDKENESTVGAPLSSSGFYSSFVHPSETAPLMNSSHFEYSISSARWEHSPVRALRPVAYIHAAASVALLYAFIIFDNDTAIVGF